MTHTLCHAPGCSAKAVRGWTRCARHYSGGMRRAEQDTALGRLTAPQRTLHAEVQLHGMARIPDRRALPTVLALAEVRLVEWHYGTRGEIVVTLPADESARLKGPWRRAELRHQAATGQEPDAVG